MKAAIVFRMGEAHEKLEVVLNGLTKVTRPTERQLAWGFYSADGSIIHFNNASVLSVTETPDE